MFKIGDQVKYQSDGFFMMYGVVTKVTKSSVFVKSSDGFIDKVAKSSVNFD
jgi:hypothetical protein